MERMTDEEIDRLIWARLNAEQRGKEVMAEAKAYEKQVGGNHYKDMSIQPMEYSMKNKFNPLQHTIIKYVSRYPFKNGLEDLHKAKHTLELLIEWEENNGHKK